MFDALFQPLAVSIDAALDLIYLGSSACRFCLGGEMRFCHHLWSHCTRSIRDTMLSSCRLRLKAHQTGFARAFPQMLLVLASVAWISFALPCGGQTTTGSIAGTVTDATGAVVPNAAVSATNASTNVASRTTADSSGHYAFLSLPAGTYTISATQSGFGTTNLTGISLRVDQQITQNLVLTVGAAKQTVTVEAAPTLVDTTSASIGTVVGQADIMDMPLNLREVTALALLVPGTVDTTGRSLATGPANGSGFNDFGYSGSGGGSGGNLLLIDGMISRALNKRRFALAPAPEMVHEF